MLYITAAVFFVSSSTEFDDVELCDSLSRPLYGSVGDSLHQHADGSQPNDLLVQDLRAQLSRCHKVIRGLQIRVRSLSATSDYASSLERTPRKVQFTYFPVSSLRLKRYTHAVCIFQNVL